MNTRAISTRIGHGVACFGLVACASGGTPTAYGVTSAQPEGNGSTTSPPSTVVRDVASPDRCLTRGSSCQTSRECCTEFCDGGVCALLSVH
jgi:hypothetical protein